MKALVINQDAQTERMAFQEQQLAALGIEFERIPAVAIHGTDDPTYQAFFNTWQRPMTVAEVSCFFSHKSAWEMIYATNQPMLILEDDAWLDENIKSVLNELSDLSDADYTTLEVARENRKKLVAKEVSANYEHANLVRLYQGRSGAAGYVLWPSGADKLLKLISNGKIGLADKFVSAVTDLNAYQVEPAMIIQLEQCAFHGITAPLEVKSTISTKTNTKLNFVDKAHYKLRRIIGEAKVGLTQLAHRKHADRRIVALSDNFKNRATPS
ncbi:glycosyltransferase family 25 protein [Leucothrix sargassi]|nr:glycosyltransferase family 25 protein [Leucothrix sargassi]